MKPLVFVLIGLIVVFAILVCGKVEEWAEPPSQTAAASPQTPLAGREPQTRPQVWGQGDPPAEWQDFFGNDNIARLNYVQNQQINKLGQVVTEITERVSRLETEKGDPNEISDVNEDD